MGFLCRQYGAQFWRTALFVPSALQDEAAAWKEKHTKLLQQAKTLRDTQRDTIKGLKEQKAGLEAEVRSLKEAASAAAEAAAAAAAAQPAAGNVAQLREAARKWRDNCVAEKKVGVFADAAGCSRCFLMYAHLLKFVDSMAGVMQLLLLLLKCSCGAHLLITLAAAPLQPLGAFFWCIGCYRSHICLCAHLNCMRVSLSACWHTPSTLQAQHAVV